MAWSDAARAAALEARRRKATRFGTTKSGATKVSMFDMRALARNIVRHGHKGTQLLFGPKGSTIKTPRAKRLTQRQTAKQLGGFSLKKR